jgi:hypothetical protein
MIRLIRKMMKTRKIRCQTISKMIGNVTSTIMVQIWTLLDTTSVSLEIFITNYNKLSIVPNKQLLWVFNQTTN